MLCEVQALSDFVAMEDKDLGFKDREILVIMETRYECIFVTSFLSVAII